MVYALLTVIVVAKKIGNSRQFGLHDFVTTLMPGDFRLCALFDKPVGQSLSAAGRADRVTPSGGVP